MGNFSYLAIEHNQCAGPQRIAAVWPGAADFKTTPKKPDSAFMMVLDMAGLQLPALTCKSNGPQFNL